MKHQELERKIDRICESAENASIEAERAQRDVEALVEHLRRLRVLDRDETDDANPDAMREMLIEIDVLLGGSGAWNAGRNAGREAVRAARRIREQMEARR